MLGYSDKVMELFNDFENMGALDEDDSRVGTGMAGSPSCGDVIKLQIEVDEQGIIRDAKFKTYGCGAAIASSSVATKWLKGKTLEEALEIKNRDIAEYLALQPVKMHCSVLAEEVIKAAVEDYQQKQQKGE